MWSLENHCRDRGRVFVNRPSVLREFSSSPVRTTPHEYVPHATQCIHDQNSHTLLLVTPANTEKAVSERKDPRSLVDTQLPTGLEQSNETQGPGSYGINSDALDLWKASQKTLQNGSDSVYSSVVEPTSMLEGVVTDEPRGLTIPKTGPDISYHSPDEPSVFDKVPTSSIEPKHATIKRPSFSRVDIALKKTGTPTTYNPTKSMYRNAKTTSIRFLQNLLDSPKLDIADQKTGEVYVKNVSQHMLEYFCGTETIASLLHKNVIFVPPTHASKDGFDRVIRYMRRWCQNAIVRPTGELRTPPSIKEGIATYLACQFFGLTIDAQHMEDLVVQDLMNGLRFFVTDEDVELIWCEYEGTLRGTPFGDAVIWFILDQIMGGTHALADEVRWILEQEDYEDLKARIRYELKRGAWRRMGRNKFLQYCSENTEVWAATDEAERSGPDRGLVQLTGEDDFVSDKPLPRPPAGF
ncbi:hypothetical protein OPT61_g3841 [Boeremia exigua]|uniref:Uncharacterized protein n=1 Tax=Boeremia exigua TaxID=749465 RepID=A0ACC2IGE2_9PLEO|nr:hypothetical protein OPT61_g3841 [Boeremia exigua]